jgi:hypothetical protein
MEIVFSLLSVLNIFAILIFVNMMWRATSERLPYFMRASLLNDLSQK